MTDHRISTTSEVVGKFLFKPFRRVDDFIFVWKDIINEVSKTKVKYVVLCEAKLDLDFAKVAKKLSENNQWLKNNAFLITKSGNMLV